MAPKGVELSIQTSKTGSTDETAVTDLRYGPRVDAVAIAGTVRAPKVVGSFTAQEALRQLLANSGLRYEFVNARTVAIRAAKRSGDDLKPIASASGNDLRLAQAEGTVKEGSTAANDPIATSQETHVDEIVVTAQKRIERLQDVPMAVSAINAETLVNNNQLRLEDYYQKLPGVSLTRQGTGGEPMIVIRGMTTVGQGNPTAGLVIDDVPFGRSTSLAFLVTMPDIDPGELSRVEVLRGPQGTLYGASSIGGLLKYVTLDPSTQRLSGRLQVGSTHIHQGDDFGHTIRGSVNVPLSDALAVRLSGFTLEDPGYIDNAETGERDVNNRESGGGRFSMLWRPSESFALKLSALMQDSELHGMTDSDTTLEPNLQRNELPGFGKTRRQIEAYSATMTGTLAALELVSTTAYTVNELDNSLEAQSLRALAGIVFPGSGRSAFTNQFEDEKFTQELRATLPIGARLSWLLGLFYTEERNQYRADLFANNNTGAPVGLLLRNLGLPGTSFEERAAFTNLTVDITERFDVQFGGRYGENDQVFNRASVPLCVTAILCASRPALDPAPTFFQTSRSTDDAFTYLATSRFKFSPDLMAYARIASGYRPGGPNFACGQLPPQLCEYDADTSTNYEIGVKGALLDRKLSFETAVYYIDWQDIQVVTTIPVNQVQTQYTDNGSRARSQGVEFSFAAKPVSSLSVTGWVVYNDAELTETVPITVPPAPAGTRLPLSSRWSGSLSAEQRFPITLWGGASGSVGLDATYVGERVNTFNLTATEPTKPSYTQFDLHAGVTFDTWTVNAFVNNLTDKRGILQGGNIVRGATTVDYIQPRAIGLSLSRDF
jgi:iron complex outermembrane recepter protein